MDEGWTGESARVGGNGEQGMMSTHEDVETIPAGRQSEAEAKKGRNNIKKMSEAGLVRE